MRCGVADCPADIDLFCACRDPVNYLLPNKPIIQHDVAGFQKIHCAKCNQLRVARAGATDKDLAILFHSLLFHSSTALRQPSAISIAPSFTSMSATLVPSFSGLAALPIFFTLMFCSPSAEKTLAYRVILSLLVTATAPSGNLHPPSTFFISARSAMTSARERESSICLSMSIKDLSSFLHTMAIAPCPGAGTNSLTPKRSTITSFMPILVSPASASTTASYSPLMTFLTRVSTFP